MCRSVCLPGRLTTGGPDLLASDGTRSESRHLQGARATAEKEAALLQQGLTGKN